MVAQKSLARMSPQELNPARRVRLLVNGRAVTLGIELPGLRDPMEDTVKSDFRKMASRAKEAHQEQSRIEKEVASAAKTARDQETEAMI